jgi:hypothetical protein
MDFYVNNMMNLKYISIIYIFNNIGPPFYVSHRGLQNLETGLPGSLARPSRAGISNTPLEANAAMVFPH